MWLTILCFRRSLLILHAYNDIAFIRLTCEKHAIRLRRQEWHIHIVIQIIFKSFGRHLRHAGIISRCLKYLWSRGEREMTVFTHGITCYLKRLCCNSLFHLYSLRKGNISILGFYDIFLISIAKCIRTTKRIEIYIFNDTQDICDDVNIYKRSLISIKKDCKLQLGTCFQQYSSTKKKTWERE